MRAIILVLSAGVLLSGCLSSEETQLTGSDNTSADNSGNQAPTISGNPPQAVLYASTYEFRPSATDPDGDSLTFQISNKPNWASFNQATGRLTGQPSLGDIGTYDNIVISVSDGTESRSLPAFSIEVSQAALGSVTLSWNAPTQNEDGSALVDLAGYEIHYGTETGRYDKTIRISSPGVTTYVVENLVPNTYFFAATSFNSSGVSSSYSSEAIRTVN